MHIIDRRGIRAAKVWRTASGSCVEPRLWFRVPSRSLRRTGTSRMSWKAARSRSRSMGCMSPASAAKAAPATWCCPATRNSSKATCCRVPATAGERRPGRVKATARMHCGSSSPAMNSSICFSTISNCRILPSASLPRRRARGFRRAGYTTSGSPANLSVSRTVRLALARRVALRRPDRARRRSPNSRPNWAIATSRAAPSCWPKSRR